MKHASHDDACVICRTNADGAAVFENDLWFVSRLADGVGVPGWMVLRSQRHLAGPAYFSDVEAASFGPTLRHLQRALEEVSGALRIYTAAWGEGVHHFHAGLAAMGLRLTLCQL